MTNSEDTELNQRYVEGASECVGRTAVEDVHVVSTRSNSSSTAGSVSNYAGEQSVPDKQGSSRDDDLPEGQVTLQKTKTGFFSPRLRNHRRKIIGKFLFTNVLLGSFVIAILSIYWGATYKRSHYMFKVSVLAVIQDESDLIETTMSAILPALIAGIPCTWHIFSAAQFSDRYNVPADRIDGKVRSLIHDEKYWMALNVRANATDALYDSLTGGSTPFNSTDYFQGIYESGRDPATVSSAIVPNMRQLETIYGSYLRDDYLPSLFGNLTDSISSERIMAASHLKFNYIDQRPFYDAQILAPLQVGLIYCLLLTFFQLSLFGPLHGEMAKILKPKHMILYRIGIAWLTYFFLSLFFCAVSAIFQIDFTKAFGRGGFIVYWMSTWLLMMALGGANENMISLIITFGPQYLGFWLMTWIVLNISCSFYPLVLNNQFYRYGYAMPIHNGVDIYKVIFLDLSKHKMGRNYGILVAWVALNTALLPFVLKTVGKRMQKKAAAAAAAANR